MFICLKYMDFRIVEFKEKKNLKKIKWLIKRKVNIIEIVYILKNVVVFVYIIIIFIKICLWNVCISINLRIVKCIENKFGNEKN